MNPYVKSVQAKDDYCLLLVFENGERRIFDMKPYFDKPIFARLKDPALFKTARVISGSVEWEGEIDLSYDTLYLEGKAAVKAQFRRKTMRGQKKSPIGSVIQRKRLPKTQVALK